MITPTGRSCRRRTSGPIARRWPMKLSIIIPTLEEEAVLADTIDHALDLGDEVCVSDGGSTDRSLEIARNLGVRTVEGAAGRGGQLNRGARATSGEVLLFLHADSRLRRNSRELIQAAIDAGAVGGGFHVRYDHGSRWLTGLGNRLIRWRTSMTGSPLGDQCQFLTREAFETLGGFQDWPILEDLDLIRRLKKLGPTVVLDAPVSTSARRFESQGILRTVAGNWLIWILFLVGVSPQRLARLYRQIR